MMLSLTLQTDDGLSENDMALNVASQSPSQNESVAPNMIPVRVNVDVQANFFTGQIWTQQDLLDIHLHLEKN